MTHRGLFDEIVFPGVCGNKRKKKTTGTYMSLDLYVVLAGENQTILLLPPFTEIY